MNGRETNAVARRTGMQRTFFATLLIAAGLGAYYGLFASRGVAQPKTGAKIALHGEGVIHAMGRLEPEGTIIRLEAPSGNENARIEELFVGEGVVLKPNQTVAVLDMAKRRRAALAEAEANRNVAEMRLKQLLAGAKAGDIRAAQAAHDEAENQRKFAAKSLERARALLQRRAISEDELEKREWDLERAVHEVERTAGLLAGVKEIREVDLELARSQVRSAEASVAAAQAAVDASEVRASVAGTVLKIHARPGEKITSAGVLEMGRIEAMQAVAEVYEADALKIAPGCTARVRLESSDREIPGKVNSKALLVARKSVLTNDPVSDTDARVIEVRIDLDPASVAEFAGYSNARVRVSINVKSP